MKKILLYNEIAEDKIIKFKKTIQNKRKEKKNRKFYVSTFKYFEFRTRRRIFW